MNNYHDQDATPSAKAFRFFALLLFNNRAFSLGELADLLSMSKPAISRLIRNFESAWIGSLLREQRGRETYVRLARVQPPANIAINASAIRQVALCCEFLRRLLPESMREKNLAALGQALAFSALPNSPLHGVPAGALCKGEIDNTPWQEILEKLLEAAEKKLVCEIAYKSSGAKTGKTWFFAPKMLLAYREAIYIKGWKVTGDDPPALVYDDPMLLPLQRFLDCAITCASSGDLPDVDAENNAFGIMEIEEFELTARFCGPAAAYVAERQWSLGQTVARDGEDAVILTATMANVPEAVSWLLGFGESARVLAPDWFVKHFRGVLRGMLRLYKKPSLQNGEACAADGQAQFPG